MNDLSLFRYADRKSLKRFVIFSAAAVLWCALIFYLSSQNGYESGALSSRFTDILCRIFMPDFMGFDDESRLRVIINLHFYVRKGAHFTAYLVLGFLSMQVCLALPAPKKLMLRYLAAWSFCVFYAVTDEIHQHFVPGRAMQLRDVVIDSCGALCGILISLGVSLMVYHIKQRRGKKRRKSE